MSKLSHLIFPTPAVASLSKLPGGPGKPLHTDPAKQKDNVERRLSALEQAWQNQSATLTVGIEGQILEKVLVIEIASTMDDFYTAIRKTEGMEFLGEYDGDFDPSDEIEIFDADNNLVTRPIPKRVFLSLTNQDALAELRNLWQAYQSNQSLPHGKKKYKSLFGLLSDIRLYGVRDRLLEPGMLEYLDYFKTSNSPVNFEVELVYKAQDDDFNQNVYAVFEQAIQEAGGEIIPGSELILPELHYHGLVAEAPSSSFNELSENTNVKFLKSGSVLVFRPVGQIIHPLLDEENLPGEEEKIPSEEMPEVPFLKGPVVALFDGLPLRNHRRLEGRLIVDDPDQFEERYLATHQVHSTSMSSLIIHGDHNEAGTAIQSKLYVRPIMRPKMREDGKWVEQLPENRLFADLLIRAVKRMKEVDLETGEAPVAPDVKIINLAIGDPDRPFLFNLSPWAKVIDWLSYKYNVLFVVSAGNCTENITIPSQNDLGEILSIAEREKAIHRQIITTERHSRRILSPAEAINSITVGALNTDGCVLENEIYNNRFISENTTLPAPYSRIGYGFDRSIKPDIFYPGGKVLGRLSTSNPEIKIYYPESPHHPPGIKSAIPGQNGTLNAEGFSIGTSNATALASRHAALLHEMLETINEDGDLSTNIPDDYLTVMLKALLVHGATWDTGVDVYRQIFNESSVIGQDSKKNIHPFLGYGNVIEQISLFSTEQCVTLLGWGSLAKKQAHQFRFPLPEALNGTLIKKRIVLTLAWLSPLNFQSSKYRKAQLYLDNLASQRNSNLQRLNNAFDFRMTGKGTVQHLVLDGNNADAFTEDASISINVNCREDASGLGNEKVRYAIAATLSIPSDSPINIYEQVRARIQQPVRVGTVAT